MQSALALILDKKAVLSQRWPRDARYISRSWAVADMWPFEIIQDRGGRHLEFVRIENSAIRSAVPENPTIEPNIWSGSDHPLQRCGHSRILGAYGTPFSEGRGGSRGSAMAPFEKAMVISYGLSIVTVALCVTIRPQFAMSPTLKSTGVGDFGPKFRGVPLGADPSCWGCKERTSQAN